MVWSDADDLNFLISLPAFRMIDYRSGKCLGRLIKRVGALEWPPRSPDLAVEDFSFREHQE